MPLRLELNQRNRIQIWLWVLDPRRNAEGKYNLVKKDPIFLHHSSSMDKTVDEFKNEVKL